MTSDIERAIEDAFRRESGAVMATLIRVLGDFDRAEDALQEAFATAVERWPHDGVPQNPGAWITTAARRKAIDRLRRASTARNNVEALTALATLEQEEAAAREQESAMSGETSSAIADDQLRLIFTCCHPALSQAARVALTLRTLCGLTTPQIARAFVLPEPTLAQRLVRAKKKIRAAKIPYRVPPAEALGERLGSVLSVIYLVFNEGYAASGGDQLLRVDLSAEAIRLGRLVAGLIPGEPEVMGLLALMVLHDSRRDTRVTPDGDLVLLEDQDRGQWDQSQIAEGCALTQRALSMGRPGPYQLQAAIAAVHAEAPTAGDTDWSQIAQLYTELFRRHPSPVVGLNRAVAIAMAEGYQEGLSLMNNLAEPLADYAPLHAARADLLRRTGSLHEAAQAYGRAIELADNEPTRRFLLKRLTEVSN